MTEEKIELGFIGSHYVNITCIGNNLNCYFEAIVHGQPHAFFREDLDFMGKHI